MKPLKFTFLLFTFLFFACNDPETSENSRSPVNLEIQESEEEKEDSSSTLNDFEEIEDLIRNVYTWHDNDNPTRIGMITDSRDSMYIGYDLVDLNQATQDLEACNFFAEEFIENYASIYLSADKKLKKKETEWLVGGLPNYGSDAEPWCNCQDAPYDAPNPWSKIELETISLTNNEGLFYWKWGGLRTDMGAGWY